MNIRIQQQDLKFKITQTELENLLGGQSVQSSVSFPERNFSVCIAPVDAANDISVSVADEGIFFQTPRSVLQELQDIGRNREGIYHQYGDISVTLQVDFRGDTRRKDKG